mmetsp:Transcript_24624/g.53780  ORF Transcript_24624/g.53780 Transcript_24624/m.53780 type:complete len:495 (-) Transcript_24624:45-1529(-)|eukprot:CAMPEP_0202913786 /NCGR_PEP_ID=MMETSP1392-20130828/61488_1 /ASSEMBLY_ACC=CAM_ASM_000868 /TAXON_ID=225041 /ORGANISM="Chlamydomonas chlamydogama, Strain SAG 11-48b" /LENGTH=494 /DNA_ID=CAMNT_0049605195 /DNA_START=304 /DNA_END=1788 /DNA_ORIENTATION=+
MGSSRQPAARSNQPSTKTPNGAAFDSEPDNAVAIQPTPDTQRYNLRSRSRAHSPPTAAGSLHMRDVSPPAPRSRSRSRSTRDGAHPAAAGVQRPDPAALAAVTTTTTTTASGRSLRQRARAPAASEPWSKPPQDLTQPSVPPGADAGASTSITPLKVPSRKRTSSGRRRMGLGFMWRYMDFEDIPEWMHDNDLIRTYYRPQMSLRQALATLFSLHNETTNVWSHLIGVLIFMGLAIWWSMAEPPVLADAQGNTCVRRAEAHLPPKWPHLVFMICIMVTLTISSMAHLLHIISARVCAMAWRLDHAGIAIGSAGAFFPICVYVFSCGDRHLAFNYLTTTCILASSVIACLVSGDTFHTMAYRPYRLAIQMSFAAWSIIPMAHSMVHMEEHAEAREALHMVWGALLVVVSGGAIYGTRCMERWFTYRVDLIGSSHNVMHAMTLCGHIIFFFAGRKLWLWRAGLEGACPGQPACQHWLTPSGTLVAGTGNGTCVYHV